MCENCCLKKWLKCTRFNYVNQKGGENELWISFASIKHNTLYLKFEIIRSIHKVYRPKRMPDFVQVHKLRNTCKTLVHPQLTIV